MKNVQTAVSLFKIQGDAAICAPLTGRTHQLRVHLQYLQRQIVDDPLYGGQMETIESELVEIQHEKGSEIDPVLLQQLAVAQLTELKALRHKDVNKICENIRFGQLLCPHCQMIAEDTPEKLINDNGVIKIANPFKYTQRQIRLHNFCYLFTTGDFIGKLPDWATGFEFTKEIEQFRRILIND